METLSFSICLIVTVCFSEQLSYHIQKTHMDALMYVKNTRAGFDITQHVLSTAKQYFRLY